MTSEQLKSEVGKWFARLDEYIDHKFTRETFDRQKQYLISVSKTLETLYSELD